MSACEFGNIKAIFRGNVEMKDLSSIAYFIHTHMRYASFSEYTFRVIHECKLLKFKTLEQVR